MTKIVGLKEIKQILETIDPIPLIEEGFVAYSQGKVVVPPVGELIFELNKRSYDSKKLVICSQGVEN